MNQFEHFTSDQDFIPADLSALTGWSEDAHIYQDDIKTSYDEYPLILSGFDSSPKEDLSANFPTWDMQFPETLETNDKLSSCASSIALPQETVTAVPPDPSLSSLTSDIIFSPEKSTWFSTNPEYNSLENIPSLALPPPAYPEISQSNLPDQIPATSEALPELTYLTDEASSSPPHLDQSNWMSSLSSFEGTPSSLNDHQFYRNPYKNAEAPTSLDTPNSTRPFSSSSRLPAYPAHSSPCQLRRTTSSGTLSRKPSSLLPSDRRVLRKSPFESPCHVNRDNQGLQRRGNGASRSVAKAKSMNNIHGSSRLHSSASSASLSHQVSTSNRSPRKHTQAKTYKESPSAEFGLAFVNFTPNDSQKLLAGVAPSGSSKTKARREQEARERKKRLEEAALRAIEQAGGNLDELERAIY